MVNTLVYFLKFPRESSPTPLTVPHVRWGVSPLLCGERVLLLIKFCYYHAGCMGAIAAVDCFCLLFCNPLSLSVSRHLVRVCGYFGIYDRGDFLRCLCLQLKFVPLWEFQLRSPWMSNDVTVCCEHLVRSTFHRLFVHFLRCRGGHLNHGRVQSRGIHQCSRSLGWQFLDALGSTIILLGTSIHISFFYQLSVQSGGFNCRAVLWNQVPVQFLL